MFASQLQQYLQREGSKPTTWGLQQIKKALDMDHKESTNVSSDSGIDEMTKKRKAGDSPASVSSEEVIICHIIIPFLHSSCLLIARKN